MSYRVALCGLTARDERLIEIVVSRAPNPKFSFTLGKASVMSDAHIAIVDEASATSADANLDKLRTNNPGLVVVTISDTGLVGDSGYCVERKSLLLKICRLLDSAVEMELLKRTPQAAAQTRRTVANGDALAISGPPPGVSPAPMQPVRALVVDDSLPVREQLASALTRLNISSETAENASSAMERLQIANFDLVFLDVVMPGADGYEVCRWIKTDAYKRSVPVLMLTSSASPFDRARGALAGCDSYLAKPVTWGTFFGAIDQVLLKHFKGDRERLSARGYREASFAA